MRIIAGRCKGRRLIAPAGAATRPTADRVRLALFDMLWHAPWGGRAAVEGASVLDAFAGTGALALEALSRGAAQAFLMERDRAAQAAIRANIAACRMECETQLLAVDVLHPPKARAACGLVFLDPPYGQGLVPRALAALAEAGWIAPEALVIAEFGQEEATAPPGFAALAERAHGPASLLVLRYGAATA